MQLSFIDTSSFKLINFSPDAFAIMYIRNKPFLLVKTNSTFSTNIIIKLQSGDNIYEATFLRDLNLGYAKKLSQVVEKVVSVSYPNFQNQWLAFFELRQFSEPCSLKYHSEVPPYGASVIINKNKNVKQHSLITNLFKFEGEAFYFLEESSLEQKGFDLITDTKMQKIYGITYTHQKLLICVPIHSILSEKPCPVNIQRKLYPILKSTCYINYRGHYCTGFLLDQHTVVSARHVIPFQEQKVGLELGVRFYPYHEEQLGYINRMGQGSVDCLIITLQKRVITKITTSNTQKIKATIFKKDYGRLVGKNVISLGFGKYAYSPHIFKKIQILMPTIESGVISKAIVLGHKTIFIKTDAALFNGFSGCGLWTEDSLVGMAIFILKNRNDHSNYNRHNFSYTISFILDLIEGIQSEQLISQINAELEYFDRIQTRHKITMFPKL